LEKGDKVLKKAIFQEEVESYMTYAFAALDIYNEAL
jgi:hypothetical protein